MMMDFLVVGFFDKVAFCFGSVFFFATAGVFFLAAGFEAVLVVGAVFLRGFTSSSSSSRLLSSRERSCIFRSLVSFMLNGAFLAFFLSCGVETPGEYTTKSSNVLLLEEACFDFGALFFLCFCLEASEDSSEISTCCDLLEDSVGKSKTALLFGFSSVEVVCCCIRAISRSAKLKGALGASVST